MKQVLLLALLMTLCSVGIAHANIQTVDQVDVLKFAGTWYRIASNPVVFEPSCICARQVLTPNSDGTVAVYNSCNKLKTGKLVEIRGTARSENPGNSKFAVDFGLPWKGQYWIIALDKDYRYAAVTDNFGYSLYILSKTPQLADGLYAQVVAEAATQVTTKRLEKQNQQSCSYPQ